MKMCGFCCTTMAGVKKCEKLAYSYYIWNVHLIEIAIEFKSHCRN